VKRKWGSGSTISLRVLLELFERAIQLRLRFDKLARFEQRLEITTEGASSCAALPPPVMDGLSPMSHRLAE
jgi:hypothetical protein